MMDVQLEPVSSLHGVDSGAWFELQIYCVQFKLYRFETVCE